MSKGRLEAFSDGVIAIIITIIIMVLELHRPEGASLAALRPLLPVLLSYVLSFVYVAIYWNNHHHLFAAAKTVSGGVLWANQGLLFFLSLIPFTTDWLGDHPAAAGPVAAYGAVLLCSAVAYFILTRVLIAQPGNELLADALGRDWKGKASPPLYLIAMLLACVSPKGSIALYTAVALMWLIPDRRIEPVVKGERAAAE